jgi:hypothetical protein
MGSDDDDSATTLGGSTDASAEPVAKKRKGLSPLELLSRFKQPSQNLLHSSTSESASSDEEIEVTVPPPVVTDSFVSQDLVYGFQEYGKTPLVYNRIAERWEATQSPDVRANFEPESSQEVEVLKEASPTPYRSPLMDIPDEEILHLEHSMARQAELDYAEELLITASEEATASKIVVKCWPHMHNLVAMEVCLKFLQAIDECDCTSELAANNNGNVKGNKWTRLHDVCQAGSNESTDDGGSQRGLLGGALAPLANPSKMKGKAQDIWKYVVRESEKPNHKIPRVVVAMCRRQNTEYNKTRTDDKEATRMKSEKDTELKAAMEMYQAGRGAMPPGAKGQEGTGRREHSTNLRADEPAAFAWANASTNVSASTAGRAGRKSPTPVASAGGRSKSPASSLSASGQSSSNQSSTADTVLGIGTALSEVWSHISLQRGLVAGTAVLPKKATPSRREKLQLMLKHQMDIMTFTGSHQQSTLMSQQYEMASLEFARVNKEIALLDAANLAMLGDEE